MSDRLVLYGYKYSVYTRIARLVMHEKQLTYASVEVDSFDPDCAEILAQLHPFARVPVLRHDDFLLYETAAIARYIDAVFETPNLTPQNPKAQARMAQCIAIVDSYAYWPMVRKVFSHRVFQPAVGEDFDQETITNGLHASHIVLAALETIAAEGRVLNGKDLTLADCHLAPMLDYFTRAAEGSEALQSYPALNQWWQWISATPRMIATDPGLP